MKFKLNTAISYNSSVSNRWFKVKVKRTDTLEIIMMEYLLVLGMFSRWFEHSRIWRLILLLLFFVLLSKRKFVHELGKILGSLWFITPVILFTLSGIFGESKEYLFFNINRISWPLIIATSIAVIVFTKPKVVSKLFDINFYFLNFFWIVNLIVLAIQCSGTPLFIKSSWLEINPYYKDQCCGLFGMNGTHELSAFSVFIIMYDLYYGYFKELKLKRSILIGFAFFTAAAMMLLSTQNDNMSLLFILPYFLLLFYLQKAVWLGKNIITKVAKIFRYLIPLIILLIVTLQIPMIRDFMNIYVYNRLIRLLHPGTNNSGSSVRLAAVMYSLTKGKGWFLGYGVGTYPFAEGVIEGQFHGFSNFGLSSMSTYVMLGGIWVYLSSAFLFARYLYLASYKKKKTGCYFIVCIGTVILFTFYTVLFNSFQTMLWLMMTFIVFGFCKDNIMKNKTQSFEVTVK